MFVLIGSILLDRTVCIARMRPIVVVLVAWSVCQVGVRFASYRTEPAFAILCK